MRRACYYLQSLLSRREDDVRQVVITTSPACDSALFATTARLYDRSPRKINTHDRARQELLSGRSRSKCKTGAASWCLLPACLPSWFLRHKLPQPSIHVRPSHISLRALATLYRPSYDRNNAAPHAYIADTPYIHTPSPYMALFVLILLLRRTDPWPAPAYRDESRAMQDIACIEDF